MTAVFRADDSQSNAYARFPVQSLQQKTIFDANNFSTPTQIAFSSTSVLGSRVGRILISTNDTLDNQILYYLHDGVQISELPFAFDGVPALSGSGSDVNKPTINSLRSTTFEQFVDLDNNGNSYFMLQAGYSIYARLLNTVSVNKKVQVLAWTDDY